MTELSFLVDLLLNHKLPKGTLAAIAARIKEVECGLSAAPVVAAPAFRVQPVAGTLPIPPHMVGQSASTIAAMMRQEQAGAPAATPIAQPDAAVVLAAPPPPQPVAVVAQTPAAVAAINDRQTAIAAQISGKPEKGRTSPRKF